MLELIIIYIQIWLKIIFDLLFSLNICGLLDWLAIIGVKLLNLNNLVILIDQSLIKMCTLLGTCFIPNGNMIFHGTSLSRLTNFLFLIWLNNLASSPISYLSLDLILFSITSLLSKSRYRIKLLYRRQWTLLCWIISDFSFKTLCKWRLNLLLALGCLLVWELKIITNPIYLDCN